MSKFFIVDAYSAAQQALENYLSENLPTVQAQTITSLDVAQKSLNNQVAGIFIDIFRFDLRDSLEFIRFVRDNYTWISVVLWINEDEFSVYEGRLPEAMAQRFKHYFRLSKDYRSDQFGTQIIAIASAIDGAYQRYHNNPLVKAVTEANVALGSLTEKRAFISYAHTDSEFVDWLSQQLTERGITIWLDRKDIRPGDVWDDRINDALNDCGAMILVLSPDSMTSKNVPREWKFFMETLDKPLIPVLWRDCKPHFQLVHLQHIDLRDRRIERVEALANALRALLTT